MQALYLICCAAILGRCGTLQVAILDIFVVGNPRILQ
jgi:hypothetical protein